jgi:hypothetical protein
MRFGQKMYTKLCSSAISLLNHVAVLSKSDSLQKWLAPCSTDVHRVARTIDACILEQEPHRQT